MIENTLRDYQYEAVDELRDATGRSGSVVLVLPTGAGKTVVAGEIARLAAERGSRTLLLVHRRELVKQSLKTLTEAVPGVLVGVEAAGWEPTPWAPLQVGSVSSIVRRNWDVNPRIVIVDEAHHARAKTWEMVLARWPNATVIGLTATPERLDGKGLGEHFAEMSLGPTIDELSSTINPATGITYLAPCRTLTLPAAIALDGVRKTRHGDYLRADVEERVTGRVIAAAADAYLMHAAGKRAIFFGVHRDHSRRVCEELRKRGVRAEHVDGKDPIPRRDRIMQEFRDGAIDVIGNCQLIEEGFDAPACEVVMLGSPTKSVTRFLQQAGRAMRPGPDKTALILDLAGICHDLGLPDDVREWSLADGEVAEERRASKQALRVCERCHTGFYGRECPACKHVTPLPPIAEVVTRLEEAKSLKQRKPKTSRAVAMSRAHALVGQCQTREQFISAAQRLAAELGFKPTWAFMAASLVWDVRQQGRRASK